VLSGFHGLFGPPDEALLISEFERSGMIGQLRGVFGADPVLNRDQHAVRRDDPIRNVMGFVGLHNDYQLGSMGVGGSLTLWTPFVPCVDERQSRLLMLHLGEEAPVGQFSLGYEIARRDPLTVQAQYEHLFATQRCYAPYVDLGSAILFDSTVYHGTYRPAQADQVRSSMDFRVSPPYTVTNPDLRGVIFRGGEIFRGAA
jgi:hypothetical protein